MKRRMIIKNKDFEDLKKALDILVLNVKGNMKKDDEGNVEVFFNSDADVSRFFDSYHGFTVKVHEFISKCEEKEK